MALSGLRIGVLFTALGMGSAVAILDATPLQPTTSAGELWDKAIAAKGGREALARIQSVLIRWRSGRGCGLDLIVPPSHLWQWEDVRGYRLGLTVRHIDLEAGKVQAESIGRSTAASRANWRVSDAERQALVAPLLMAFLETSWLRPTVLGGEVLSKGAMLRVEWQGSSVAYVIDANARPKELTLRRASPSGAFDIRTVLRDYRVVDGLDLPHRTEEWIKGKRSGGRVLEYRLNPPFEQRLFSREPSVAAGPDGWQLAPDDARPASLVPGGVIARDCGGSLTPKTAS